MNCDFVSHLNSSSSNKIDFRVYCTMLKELQKRGNFMGMGVEAEFSSMQLS